MSRPDRRRPRDIKQCDPGRKESALVVTSDRLGSRFIVVSKRGTGMRKTVVLITAAQAPFSSELRTMLAQGALRGPRSLRPPHRHSVSGQNATINDGAFGWNLICSSTSRTSHHRHYERKQAPWCDTGGSPMHVEEDLGLGEARWEPVPRLSLVHRASAISDQFSVSIVNRNDQPAMHQPRSRVEADAKFARPTPVCLKGCTCRR